jgi:hypothetical protein
MPLGGPFIINLQDPPLEIGIRAFGRSFVVCFPRRALCNFPAKTCDQGNDVIDELLVHCHLFGCLLRYHDF